MAALLISVLVGVAGILATRATLRRLATNSAPRDPHVYWSLGLAGVLPAWLVLFVTLLDATSSGRRAFASALPWVLSATTGLIGAIAGEAWVRRASDAPQALAPTRGWQVGLWSGVPAWAIAALGHLLRLFV